MSHSPLPIPTRQGRVRLFPASLPASLKAALWILALGLAQLPTREAKACSWPAYGPRGQLFPSCPFHRGPAPDGGGLGTPISGDSGYRGESFAPIVGGPLDVIGDSMETATIYERMTDLSIPVKHGMNLEVRRVFSSEMADSPPDGFPDNRHGQGALGYFNAYSENANWRLLPYECKIKSINLTSPDRWVYVFFDGQGNHIVFDYYDKTSYADGNKLLPPIDDMWDDTLTTASIYVPTGDSRGYHHENHGSPPDRADRQTARDLTLYVLHNTMPSTPYDRSVHPDPDNIRGYVLRDANGMQMYFELLDPDNANAVAQTTGHLRFIDANWRNNVRPSESGHVDDYIEVTWKDAYKKNGTAGSSYTYTSGIKALDEVKAPPSDGRKLVMKHETATISGATHDLTDVVGVDLQAGGTAYSDLVRYDYYTMTPTSGSGHLWRVWPGNNATVGTQYDYGLLEMDGSGFPLDIDSGSLGTDYHDIAIYSEVTKTGPSSYTTKAVLANQRYASGGNTFTRQWVRDPYTDSWRRAFRHEIVTISSVAHQKLFWEDGQIGTDAATRYTPNSSETYSIYNVLPLDSMSKKRGDIEYLDYGNLGSYQAPPISKFTYYHGSQTSDVDYTRLLHEDQLQVVETSGGSTYTSWVNMKEVIPFDVVGGGSSANNVFSGIDRPIKIIRYSGMRETGGGTHLYEADPDTAQETDFFYEDTDAPEFASKVNRPDGGQDNYDYNDSGQLLTYVRKQYNTDTATTDTLTTTTYTYVASPWTFNDEVNAGLVESVTTEPAVGPTHVVFYFYTVPDGGGINAGRLESVVVDDVPTTYTYNDFSDVKTVTTVDGTATNAYSDELTTTSANYFLPPRLLSVTDAADNLTTYSYDDHGRISAVLAAAGEGIAQLTQYDYDLHDNVKKVTANDDSFTSYTYDIYGKLRAMQDQDGTVTSYTRDPFGRVIEESVIKAGDENPLYYINYKYVESGSLGGGCSCSGSGGANQVAERTIANGDRTTTETITFTYDLLGRIVSQHEDLNDSTFTYSYGTGTYDKGNLVEIDHGGVPFGNGKLDYEYDGLQRLKREIYPLGRSIDFTYDAVGRLVTVKDPFGFVNKVAYDDDVKGRLDSLTHSSLGQAVFRYDSNDRLTSLTLGNGAMTKYTYDGTGRLTAFDILDGEASRILKHSWGYDALNRKGDIDIASSNGDLDGEQIQITYDDVNRLTHEKLTHGGGSHWDVTYGYDDAGNRTSYNPGTSYTMSYGTGNRETGASAGDGLAYDFKGNVTMRSPLAGGVNRDYSWDAYDRLILCAPEDGLKVAGYGYDAMGRMLARAELDLTSYTLDFKLNYWLGLNKIAEERYLGIGDDTEMIARPDSEAGTDPGANGWWDPTESDTMEYTTDSSAAPRGKVLGLAGTHFFGGGAFIMGDTGDDFTPNDPLALGGGRVGLWFKNNNAVTTSTVMLEFWGLDQSDQPFQAYFITDDGDDYADSGAYYIYLGSALNDGAWHYVECDVPQKMEDLGAPDPFKQIDVIAVFGEALDINLDDIIVGYGVLEKAYQLSPKAPLGGYLGAQSGSSGGIDQEPWSRWWYHYNSLGSTLVSSDNSGQPISISEPDFFGTYRFDAGTRPELMGLTGQFYDTLTGLYNYPFRAFDPERGSWTSKEPLAWDGPNFYQFVYNNPAGNFDIAGLATIIMDGIATPVPKPTPGPPNPFPIPNDPPPQLLLACIYDAAIAAREDGKKTDPGSSRLDANGYKMLHCLLGCYLKKNCGLGRLGTLLVGLTIEVDELIPVNPHSGPDHTEISVARRRGYGYLHDTYGDLNAADTGNQVAECETCTHRCSDANNWTIGGNQQTGHPDTIPTPVHVPTPTPPQY